MKTSELKDRALDWAVAKCLGQENCWMHDYKIGYPVSISTDWSQAGPIIERERISVHDFDGLWVAAMFDRTSFGAPKKRETPGNDVFGKYVVLHHEFGISPLEAAMRCYVASKLGDDVDVPEELQ